MSTNLCVTAAAALICVAYCADAAQTVVALTTAAPELAPLLTCITHQLADSGPLVQTPELKEGMEFRITRSPNATAPQIVVITALLKPDVTALGDPHDDPEAQPAAAARVYGLMRIPLGSRAWVRHSGHDRDICLEAGAWIKDLRGKPVLFDHLDSDGEWHGRPSR